MKRLKSKILLGLFVLVLFMGMLPEPAQIVFAEDTNTGGPHHAMNFRMAMDHQDPLEVDADVESEDRSSPDSKEESKDEDEGSAAGDEAIPDDEPGEENTSTAAKNKSSSSKELEDGLVRIKETGQLFQSIANAISEANNTNLKTFTLEITGDVTETGKITIGSNTTIVGAEGAHTVTLSSSIAVQNGGALTLGNGKDTDRLTISSGGDTISVTNGTITAKDGIKLKSSSSYAITMSGTNAAGSISGGIFDGKRSTLDMEKGAKISEISGGTFTGDREEGIYLTDAGTRIEKISGGNFYQMDSTTTLHGQAVFVQNGAQIGEISGGYFEAAHGNAIIIVRGAWVDKISGGTFMAKHVTPPVSATCDATVYVLGEGTKTGIGNISGGYFGGSYFGLLNLNSSGQGAQIDAITGGTFEGTVALQNDVNGLIKEITGGQFNGSQGMLNAGTIGEIGGTANIKGKSSYGIYNYVKAQINEISGGTINSGTSHGIMNSGTIKLVSGGTIIGSLNAINSVSSNPANNGKLEKITNGVFWGKEAVALRLAFPLTLEPELKTSKGLGRYWGKDGVVFNDENLVTYPFNDQVEQWYEMSTKTTTVQGIDATGFKFLMLPGVLIHTVTVEESFAENTGAGAYEEGEAVTINAGSRDGYTFAGWETEDDVSLDDVSSDTTTFSMPDTDVTVTATWKNNKDNPPHQEDEDENLPPDDEGDSTPPDDDSTPPDDEDGTPSADDDGDRPLEDGDNGLPITGDSGMLFVQIIGSMAMVILIYIVVVETRKRNIRLRRIR